MDVVQEKVKKPKKLNKSVYFLLPMLGIMYGFYRDVILNSYLGDNINKPHLDNYHIFILSKTEDLRFESMLSYKEHYKVPEGYMYVHRVPSEFEEDYLKFILGQYSQFSPKYKEKIIRLLPSPYQETNVFKVITKSPEAKKIIEDLVGQDIGNQEVMSIPDFGEEIYE